jgi:hypothetical protein
MLARFQGVTGDGAVIDVGGKDIDHIDTAVLEEFFIIGADFSSRSAEFPTGLYRPFFNNVTKVDNLYFVFKQGQRGEVFLVGDTAAAHNAYLDFAHLPASFVTFPM